MYAVSHEKCVNYNAGIYCAIFTICTDGNRNEYSTIAD